MSALKCPICKKKVSRKDDSATPNPYFPFCSDRCKLIDLGRWLDGKYQIVQSADEDAGDGAEVNQEDSDGDLP